MSSVSPSRNAAEFVDQLPVRHRIDLSDARPGALLDVEQQARTAESLVLVELRRAARADREAPQQQVEGVADRIGVGVRTEVPGSLALPAAHHQRPRPVVVHGDGEERVALVVAEPNVEPRIVLLDEAELEHEGLDLVADRGPLHRLGGRPPSARCAGACCAATGSSSTGAGAGSRPCRRRSPGRGRP